MTLFMVCQVYVNLQDLMVCCGFAAAERVSDGTPPMTLSNDIFSYTPCTNNCMFGTESTYHNSIALNCIRGPSDEVASLRQRIEYQVTLRSVGE